MATSSSSAPRSGSAQGRRRRPRWGLLVLLVALLAPLLWPARDLAVDYYTGMYTDRSRQTLDLFVANLAGTLSRYEVVPELLGGQPAIRELLVNAGSQSVSDLNRADANRLLARTRAQTGADVIYAMAPDGETLAASNWRDGDSFVGKNFSFRPYFKEALGGRLGRFFGLGTTSGKRGYYFASPVREGDTVIGVVVVKVDLDALETLLGGTSERLLVTDRHGVVIMTSIPGWRFHATRALSAAELREIAANIPYPTTNPTPLGLDPADWLTQSRALPETRWNASILVPTPLIDAQVRGAVAATLAFLLVLVALVAVLIQRRRHYLDRIAIDSRVRRELEQRVQERTQVLESLNSRLREEVLERERTQQALYHTQDELVQAGKLSALGTMAASIGHELNQPLGAIRSYADNARVLLDKGREGAARDNLQRISQLTGRMAAIITDLKAFARRDSRAPVSLPLQPAVDESLATLQERLTAAGVQVHQNLPADPIWIQAGESRLRQVLVNLLTNSIDALESRQNDGEPPQLWLDAARDEASGCWVLSLRDNGPGFSSEALARAREPFFTTKARTQGLGLGLAICDSFLETFGGRLELANACGALDNGALPAAILKPGAVVRVYLQAGEKVTLPRQSPQEPECPAGVAAETDTGKKPMPEIRTAHDK